MTALARNSCMALLALVASSSAHAQALSDPMRPPAQWLATQSKGDSAGGSLGAESLPQLQSVLISPSRRYAIVEGQLVGVGDAFLDGKVIAVHASEVVMRSERGTQTLKLFPDVNLRPSQSAATGQGTPPKVGSKRGEHRSTVIKENK